MRATRDVEGGGVPAARRPGGVQVDGIAGEGAGAASRAGRGDVQRGRGGLPEWRGVAAGVVADGGVFLYPYVYIEVYI